MFKIIALNCNVYDLHGVHPGLRNEYNNTANTLSIWISNAGACQNYLDNLNIEIRFSMIELSILN